MIDNFKDADFEVDTQRDWEIVALEYNNDIEVLIEKLREADGYITTIFLLGGCYKFAKFLQFYFGGDIVVNKECNHA